MVLNCSIEYFSFLGIISGGRIISQLSKLEKLKYIFSKSSYLKNGPELPRPHGSE